MVVRRKVKVMRRRRGVVFGVEREYMVMCCTRLVLILEDKRSPWVFRV